MPQRQRPGFREVAGAVSSRCSSRVLPGNRGGEMLTRALQGAEHSPGQAGARTQAVFQAAVWVIPKAGASPAPTLADHRMTSGGGKPTGSGCAGATRFLRSRCSQGCCVGAGCLVWWQTRAQIRGNLVKPQPRGGGDTTSCYRGIFPPRPRPWLFPQALRVSLPSRQLFSAPAS